jgi:hypothetical protein
VLTLNTREDKPQNILKTFVHEQFHWFATLNKNYAQCIGYLKTNYQDLNEGKLPNSHWEHLIVCWNTRNFLKKILTQDEFISVYTDWQAYPLTEKFVEENFDKLKTDLDQWGMVYLG